MTYDSVPIVENDLPSGRLVEVLVQSDRCSQPIARKRPMPMRPWVVVSVSLLCGCASTGEPLRVVAQKANAGRDVGPAMIAPGDMLDLRFGGKEDWNQAVRVWPDGTASFPALSPMAIAGLSSDELKQRLDQAYAGMLAKPEVSVGITTFGNRHVYVFGEVHEPGEIPLEGSLSFLEAIGRAGGPLKETALMKSVMLVRWRPYSKTHQVWQIDARQDRWGEGEQLLLQNHDVIFVPNTPIDEIDIWIDQYIRRLIPFPYLVAPGAAGGV